MPFEYNQPLQSQLNGRIHAHMHGYDGSTHTARRPQAERQFVHAHVHEYGVIAPQTRIEANQEARVHVRWTMDGEGVPTIAGTWYVSAFLESFTPGETLRMPLTPGEAISLTPQPGPVDYEAWVKIPANTVTLTDAMQTRAYRLVVTVTYHAPIEQPVVQAKGANGPAFPTYIVLATTLKYAAPTGQPDPVTEVVDGPTLQFFIVA